MNVTPSSIPRLFEWFDAATQMAHVRPHVLLESGAPSTLVALAQAGYGIAIVASTLRIPRGRVRLSIAWDPRRFLAAFAEQFVDELVAYSKRDAAAKPGFTRRVPLLPPPKEPATVASMNCRRDHPAWPAADSRRSRSKAALMRARCVNAWGKLPRCCA